MKERSRKILIGTRGSPLALRQARLVRTALCACDPDLQAELAVIKTSGDWHPAQGETRLSGEQGGKGQFAKEIEAALLAGEIDIGVHSMKDMETDLPRGLIIPCTLPRQDARDALLVSQPLRGRIKTLEDLPQGAIVGTASVRRQALALARRPDLKVVPLRGNVETRLAKLRSGQVDATFLACAGLSRLGLTEEIDAVMEPEIMLPAAGQGVIGIEIKSDNSFLLAILDQINCRETLWRVTAERAVLAALEGSCHTPIGVYAVFEGQETLWLRACVASPGGAEIYADEIRGAVRCFEDTGKLGAALGCKLKKRLPPGLLMSRHGHTGGERS